jgi:hypothetical protein
MLERGIPQEDVERTCYRNALEAYGQSRKFAEAHWSGATRVDQRELFEGNSVLRGQAPENRDAVAEFVIR